VEAEPGTRRSSSAVEKEIKHEDTVRDSACQCHTVFAVEALTPYSDAVLIVVDK
jgi:hypothetical protein